MSSSLPEVPESWGKFLRDIAIIIGLLINFATTFWTNRKSTDLQQHAITNSAKIDEVKADSAKMKAAVIKE